MSTMKKLGYTGISMIFMLTLTACAPEVGSEKWCANMKEKNKADWTANEAADFTKHCIFK